MKDLKRKNKYSVDPFPPEPEFTKGEMIACPASAEFLDPLAQGYKLHWVHPSKLVNGVCPACARKFAKRGVPKSEVPVDLNERLHPADPVDGDDTIDHHGHIEKITVVNHDEIDALLGLAQSVPKDSIRVAGEFIREIFAYCFAVQFRRKGSLKLAAAKLAVIASGLSPNLLGGATKSQIAKSLGLTKQAVSYTSVKFRDAFNLPPQNGREHDQESRETMRKIRLANPVGRHFAKKS